MKNLKPITYNLKPSRGFTFIELIIVLSLFSIVVLAVSGVFLTYSRTQRRLNSGEQIISTIRVANETIARDIRTAQIDYPNQAGADELHLLDISGAAPVTIIYQPGSNPNCLERVVGGVVAPLLDCGSLSVLDANFYVAPSTDPFAVGGPDEQPHVTYNLVFQNLIGSGLEQKTVYLQNTVSSRIYLR